MCKTPVAFLLGESHLQDLTTSCRNLRPDSSIVYKIPDSSFARTSHPFSARPLLLVSRL